MPKVAITYSSIVGGSSVISLQKSFKHVGSTVVDADYREMMADIPEDQFNKLYETPQGRRQLFAHAKAKAQELLKDIDCLAMSGNNAMIDPELFNKSRDEAEVYDFSRTVVELALTHIAIEKGMPILGVCGGHQVIAVYGGGEISDLKSSQLDKQSYMNYDLIKFNKDTMLAQIFGIYLKENANSSYYGGQFFGAHSQGVSKLARGYIPSGLASDDQTNESAESSFGVPILTTQFHPEIGAKGLPEAKFIYKRTKLDTEANLKVFDYMNRAALTYEQKKTVAQELTQSKPAADHMNIKPSQVKAHMIETGKKTNYVVSAAPPATKRKKSSYWIPILGVGLLFGVIVSALSFFFFPAALATVIGGIGVAAISFAAGVVATSLFWGVAYIADQLSSLFMEHVAPVVATAMRNRIADAMTKLVSSGLRQKEEKQMMLNSDKELSDSSLGSDNLKSNSFSTIFEDLNQKSESKHQSPEEILTEIPASLWIDDKSTKNEELIYEGSKDKSYSIEVVEKQEENDEEQKYSKTYS